jgi:curli production assembly/transport component CsgG
MLIKALTEAGNGTWFTVLERESISNLLNERKIIQQTRQQYAGSTGNDLTPLLYSPLIYEGGVVAYQSNSLTGGVGARYLGIGGSTDFQRDFVSIYLRLVSVKNGQILQSVDTAKTIFSFKVDAAAFKFVALKDLLEVEAGFTSNEPSQMAVLEAIEKAVYASVLEGSMGGLWQFKDSNRAKEIIAEYKEEKNDDYMSSSSLASDALPSEVVDISKQPIEPAKSWFSNPFSSDDKPVVQPVKPAPAKTHPH